MAEKTSQLLEKVTIIIPTYNRYDKLERLLSYLDSFGYKINIVILDSSSDKIITDTMQSYFLNNGIKYIEYSFDIHPYNKIANGLNYVDTPYSVICADDDFILPRGIRSAVDFLRDNSDYAVAHGQYISFWPPGNRIDRGGKFCWRPRYVSRSVDFDNPLERMFHYFSHYTSPVFYGLYRTDLLKMVMNETAKYTNDMRFGEHLAAIITLIHGKEKRLDTLYYGREVRLQKIKMKDLNDYIEDGSYEYKYKKFRACLSFHICKKTNLSITEVEIEIDRAMAKYLKRRFKKVKGKLEIRKDSEKSVVGRMKNKIRTLMKCNYLFSSLYDLLKRSYHDSKLYDSNLFYEYPPSQDSEAFELIRSHIVRFSKSI